MANIYWNKPKDPYTEVEAKLKKLAVDATDGAFHILRDGSEIGVYAEGEDPNNKSCWKQRLPPQLGGWRIIMYNCPVGYIDVFLREKEK